MRYGLFSDVHSNAKSLCRALTILKPRVDKIFHLGDIIGGVAGNSENSELAINILKSNGIEGVGGYHDEEWEIERENLSESAREFLTRLPKMISLNGGTILTHANPVPLYSQGGPWIAGGYIQKMPDAKKVFDGCKHKTMLIGHTHIASAFSDSGEQHLFKEGGKIELDPSKRYILNPGSVGEPRDGSFFSVAIYDPGARTFEVIRYKK